MEFCHLEREQQNPTLGTYTNSDDPPTKAPLLPSLQKKQNGSRIWLVIVIRGAAKVSKASVSPSGIRHQGSRITGFQNQM